MKKTITIILICISISSFGQITPPTQKPDTSTYFLIGKISDFQILYLAIKSPQDVTPRQDTLLLRWIEKIQKPQKQKSDSINIKK